MLFSALPAKGGNKQEGGFEAGGFGASIIRERSAPRPDEL